MSTPHTTAERLLDAQVVWLLAELSGDRLLEVIERDVDALLEAAGDVRLRDVASPEDVVPLLELLLVRLPPSAAATSIVRATADQVHAGPDAGIVPGDVVDRADVAALIDAALALRPLVAQTLDRLTESPAAGVLASRFVTKLVVDVLEMNRSMTSRIPGVGSIVSLGTSAATKMVGVADKQVQALFGDTAGKGAAMAVRRLNQVVLGTLDDPMFRDAVLEVYDAYADRPLDGIDDVVARRDVRRLADVLQRVVASAAPSLAVRSFVAAWVRAVFALYGDDDLATVLDALGITRDDVLEAATTVVPPLVEAVVADGRLEQALRTRLEPFFRSPVVDAILAEAAGPS